MRFIKINTLRSVILLVGYLLISHANAATAPEDKDKITSLGLYLTAKEAYGIKISEKEKVLFIDVRTRAELAFLGMATDVDANIPYMLVGDWDEWDDKKQNFKMYPNSNFLPYFEEYVNEHNFNKNSKIILICRSGNRSSAAANLLAKVNYTNVYSVVDGFEGDKSKADEKCTRNINGWKNMDLPWSYKLDEDKMYMEL